MIELTAGPAEYFTFYNGERPHQSLGQKTPDVVYRTGIGGGAVIVNKYPREVDGTGVPSTSESAPEVSAEAKPRQRRPAALEVECPA